MHPVLLRKNEFLGDDSHELSYDQVKKTYAEAHAAFSLLKSHSLQNRLGELKRIKKFILANSERIIDKIVDETFKCRTDALTAEIFGVLDFIEYLLTKSPQILLDQKVKTPFLLFGKKSMISHQPLGVVLIIAPWNYPFYIGFTQIIAAFIAGNAVIFKPSEHTPLMWLFEEILSSSPLMQSCVRIVYGSGITGQRLVESRPAKIFFTGSAKTGRKILEQAAKTLTPVNLELGGKDAMIVWDDVSLDKTVAGALWGALTNAGQSCSSIERIYVHKNIYADFLEKIKIKIQDLILNHPDQGNADIGAMTTDFQVDHVLKQIAEAVDKGATVHAGGVCLDKATRFFQPTIITDIPDHCSLMLDETFGPILAVIPFTTEEEAIQQVNRSEYGLSASVWSGSLERAKRIASRLEVGSVSINNVLLTEANPALPFGGVKSSGYGRTKGAEGLLQFTYSKSIIFEKMSNKLEAHWFPYTRAKYHLFSKLISARFKFRYFWILRVIPLGIKLEKLVNKSRNL